MKEFKSKSDTSVAVFVLSMMLIAFFIMMIFSVSIKSPLFFFLMLAFSLLPSSLILHIVNYKIIYVPEEEALYQADLFGRLTKPFFLSEIMRVKVTHLTTDSGPETCVLVKGKKGTIYFSSDVSDFDTLLEIVQAYSAQEGQKQRS